MTVSTACDENRLLLFCRATTGNFIM